MSLEATTNAIEDHLIDSISFKLAPGASYVTDRRSVSFFPQGSNISTKTQGARTTATSVQQSPGEEFRVPSPTVPTNRKF